MSILINEKLIEINSVVESQSELFNKIFIKLVENDFVTEGFLNGIINREKKYPTGLDLGDYGVAIPHTEAEYIKKPFVYIATLKKPIPFFKMDDLSSEVLVTTVFLLGLNNSEEQLQTLQKLMPFIQNKDNIINLHKAKNPDELITIVQGNY